MIIDRIENARLYYAVHPKFEQAFNYVRQIDVHTIAAGRYEIEGDAMYAIVQEYDTKSKKRENGKPIAATSTYNMLSEAQKRSGMPISITCNRESMIPPKIFYPCSGRATRSL